MRIVEHSIVIETSNMAHKVIAYYSSWAVYRKNEGKFGVDNIDPSLLTHAIYAFVGIKPDGSIKINDPWGDINLHGYAKFNAMKKRNPRLKTMVAIGGWNEGSTTFSQVAANPALRQRFAANALAFLKKYGFDGFDLDWEYPAQRGGAPHDKQNVILLLQELRRKFNCKYLLSAAVAATNDKAKVSYDTASFCKCLDFINLMTYDFHGSFDGRTGQNAPLRPSPDNHQQGYNVEASVKGWLAQGAPRNKLILGMAAYGRSFTVQNANNHNYNSPASAGQPGPLVGQAGMLGYNEICKLKKQGGWTEKWDNVQKVPFMYKGNQWVGFDNERSIREKAIFAKEMKLGGAMVWAIDTDDTRGFSGKPFPIMRAIKSVLAEEEIPEGKDHSIKRYCCW